MAIKMKPAGIKIEYQVPKALIHCVYFGCLAPMDWKEDWNPCAKCKPNNTKAMT